MKKYLIVIFVIFFSLNISAQINQDEVQTKIKQLEAQVQTILGELDKLKKLAETQPPKTETAPEKKVETEKKIIGVEIGNGVRVVPYGTIFFNMFGNSAGTNNSDIPLFASPTGKGNTSASVRQTRFGLRIEGGNIANARVTGNIEADFFGGSPAIGTRTN